MKTRFACVVFFVLLCGCSKEEVVTEITDLREIGQLAVYKVQNADLLTGKDGGAEVKYIVYTDALICVDFSEVEIQKVERGESTVYRIKFPEFTVEQPRVVRGDGFSRPWNPTASRGKSTFKVEKALLGAAEDAIADKAKNSEDVMKLALEQAHSVVETMIRASDKKAEFEYPQEN